MSREEELKQGAIETLRRLSARIESGELEVSEVCQEIGITVVTSGDGAPPREIQSGDEVWTFKVHRKHYPHATFFMGDAPGVGTWRGYG